MKLKKLIRKMAKKYHPDKLQDLGAEHLKGAKRNFKISKLLTKRLKRSGNIV